MSHFFNHIIKNKSGSITLLMVFITGTILFLFLFADHTLAIKEKASSQNDAASEQAFYNAQSCL